MLSLRLELYHAYLRIFVVGHWGLYWVWHMRAKNVTI